MNTRQLVLLIHTDICTEKRNGKGKTKNKAQVLSEILNDKVQIAEPT